MTTKAYEVEFWNVGQVYPVFEEYATRNATFVGDGWNMTELDYQPNSYPKGMVFVTATDVVVDQTVLNAIGLGRNAQWYATAGKLGRRNLFSIKSKELQNDAEYHTTYDSRNENEQKVRARSRSLYLHLLSMVK